MIRGLFLTLIALVLGLPAAALGRLVQPDGTEVALGEAQAEGVDQLLFAPKTIPERSWLILPPGSRVSEVEIIAAGYHARWSFPTVPMPGVRYALEVPPRVYSLGLRGRWGSGRTVRRTLQRPGVPGQPWVLRGPEDLVVDLPPWKTADGYTGVLTLTRPVSAPWKVTFSDLREERTFSFRGTPVPFDFAPAAWGFVPTRVEVTGPQPDLSEVRVRGLGPQANLPADPETLLHWPASGWRDPRREWFSWTGTSVLVLVTADYRVQDDYLKRLAFYIEKAGYRGRMVSEADLTTLHGWNAHDYAAPDLARFYTEAHREGVALNPSEEELRDRLVATGILVPQGPGAWVPGVGALVGISTASPPALRAVLFTHEAFHGLYYTSPAFRSGVAAAWAGLSDPAREAFRSFLAVSQYDPQDEALMVNEFQAYVLQRAARDWAPFFRDRVLARVTDPAEASERLREYLAAAQTLDTLVNSLYGLRSGNVSELLRP